MNLNSKLRDCFQLEKIKEGFIKKVIHDLDFTSWINVVVQRTHTIIEQRKQAEPIFFETRS